MNDKQIHNKAKKLLAGLFACALIGGFNYVHQTQAHADIWDMDLKADQVRADQDAFHLEGELNREAMHEKTQEMSDLLNNSNSDNYDANSDYIPSSEQMPSWFERKVSKEKPLSEIYPNGAEENSDGTITINESPEEIKQSDEQTAEENKRNLRWCRQHSYYHKNYIHHVNYNGFSYKHYRKAFIDPYSGFQKIGLTKSWKTAKRSAYGPSRTKTIVYHADIILTPKDVFYAKILKNLGKGDYIYRIRFHHHYYYYVSECDKFSSNIYPYMARLTDETYKGQKLYFVESVYKPWKIGTLYLSKKTNINHKNFEWEYEWGKNGSNEIDYYHVGNYWVNAGDGLDIPKWLGEGTNFTNHYDPYTNSFK